MNKSLQSLRITLLNIDHVHLNNSWDYSNVSSPFSRLYFIRSGKANVYHHNQLFELKPGYLYLIPSFTYSRYKCYHKLEQVYIHFLEEVGNGLSIYGLRSFKYQVKATTFIRRLIERLLELNPNRALSKEDPQLYDNPPSLKSFEIRNNSIKTPHYIETHGILQILLSLFVEEKNVVINKVNYNTNRILETLYYISEQLHEELTVEKLAGRCHINRDHFSRLFKEQTGIRPLPYLQNKRIERAQLLLTTTNHSLQEIGDMVGLPNGSYFCRLFLKLTKKTPGSYRKENWNI